MKTVRMLFLIALIWALCFSSPNAAPAAAATALLLMFNQHPWKKRQLSSLVEVHDQVDTQNGQILKNPSLGTGYGYRAFLERSSAPEPNVTAGVGVQYNARHGIYRGEQQRVTGSGAGMRYRLGAAVAFAYVGRKATITRPVPDSFGVVKVGNLEGVRVYQSSQEMGRTDADGMVFLPNLNSYYENQIQIEDKDIPLDYSLTNVTRFVAPPPRCAATPASPSRRISSSR